MYVEGSFGNGTGPGAVGIVRRSRTVMLVLLLSYLVVDLK